jgi:hypothetical protein
MVYKTDNTVSPQAEWVFEPIQNCAPRDNFPVPFFLKIFRFVHLHNKTKPNVALKRLMIAGR